MVTKKAFQFLDNDDEKNKQQVKVDSLENEKRCTIALVPQLLGPLFFDSFLGSFLPYLHVRKYLFIVEPSICPMGQW